MAAASLAALQQMSLLVIRCVGNVHVPYCGGIVEEGKCIAYAVAGFGIHNPNTDKIISFRGSRIALTEVTGHVTLEEAASCDPGTRRKDALTAG